MWMIQRRQRLGFAREPRNPIEARGQRFGKDFDGDVPIEASVARAIDLAHPARAEARRDLENADSCARTQGHGRGAL
jgi:hypothetical protein